MCIPFKCISTTLTCNLHKVKDEKTKGGKEEKERIAKVFYEVMKISQSFKSRKKLNDTCIA